MRLQRSRWLLSRPCTELRVFKVYEHGQVLDEWAAVVGTVQASHGRVWYLVELAKRTHSRREG